LIDQFNQSIKWSESDQKYMIPRPVNNDNILITEIDQLKDQLNKYL